MTIAAVAAPPVARDAVFAYFGVTWASSRRRGMNFAQDRIAARMLHDPAVRRLLLADAYASLPARAYRRATGDAAEPFPRSERAALCRPLRWRRTDPVAVPALERTYRGYDRRLRAAARRQGLDRPALLTTNPFLAAFAPLEWAGSVTFYATDDWTAHHKLQPWRPALETAFERIREARRRVLAVSEPIIDRIAPHGPSLVVPNGIEPAEWIEPGPAAEWFLRLPSPRALYVGTLDSRIDVDAVRAVAEAYPDGSVVLVGTWADLDHLAALRALPNVHLERRLPREEVAALTAAAEICLIPHVRNQLTEAMSPLKLYEYLAAGRPVAAVDLPPIRTVESGRLATAAPGGDFAGAVRAALAAGPAPEDERLAFIEENSWSRRHEAVLRFALAEDV